MGIFRSVFGPSRDEVWRHLCNETGAEFVDAGFWKGKKVRFRHPPWTITLDILVVSSQHHHTTYTRVRSPFVSTNGFRFSVYRKGFFSELGKLLGMQDVEIGEPMFDEAFIIKGTDEEKLRELFASPRLRELIEQQAQIHLSVIDHEGWFAVRFPVDEDELRFQIVGDIRDVDQLKTVFELFAETLDRLAQIGAAAQDAPTLIL